MAEPNGEPCNIADRAFYLSLVLMSATDASLETFCRKGEKGDLKMLISFSEAKAEIKSEMPQIKKRHPEIKIKMEIKDTYNTIAAPSQGEYKEKGSKFIGLSFEVEDEAEIKFHLEEVKKEHFKARHHCYAWRLGQGKDSYRANDDGEPSSTAGRPILGQIDSFGLTNLLLVVVRYYGGTKLGTSGLKNAYKTAAREALTAAVVEERIIKTKFLLTIDYPQLSDVMNFLNQESIEIQDSEYTNTQVFMKLRIRNNKIALLETEAKENWNNSKIDEIV